jgi:hypothetical protein
VTFSGYPEHGVRGAPADFVNGEIASYINSLKQRWMTVFSVFLLAQKELAAIEKGELKRGKYRKDKSD